MRSRRAAILLLIVLCVMSVPLRGQGTAYTLANGQTYINTVSYPSGVLYDDGGAVGQYASNVDGMFTLTAPVGDTLHVWGSYATELDFDLLTLVDGDGLSGNVLGSFSGLGTLDVVSVTGFLTVIFTSDGNVCDEGFVLNYELIASGCVNRPSAISCNSLSATEFDISWTAADTAGLFRLRYGAVDTVVTGCHHHIGGLVPMSHYTITVSDVRDADTVNCSISRTVHTSYYPAVISGVRPLCGVADTVWLTADYADRYLWSTGDTTATTAVMAEGDYWLVAYTGDAVADTSVVHIGSIQMIVDCRVPAMLCPGDSAIVYVGLANEATVHVVRGKSTLSESNRIFLPDGVDCSPFGCSYRSELEFSGFGPNTRITSVNDIQYLMLNMEHSYAGDIYINITCPNGQQADIMRYGGSGNSSCNSTILPSSRGWQPGRNVHSGTYFGLPLDYEDSNNPCDSNSSRNVPGTGWRYCWSNNTEAGYAYALGDGLIYRYWNTVGNSLDSSNVAAGSNFYHPDVSFDSLVGCPMDGTWYIEVIDGWSLDNGYIFGWELALNPQRLRRNEDQYHATVSYADLYGCYSVRRSDTVFIITAPTDLQHDTVVNYIVTITDSIGCQFDTPFAVLFKASTRRVAYDTVVENQLPVRRYGHTFTTDTTGVDIRVDMDPGCDSTIIYNLYVCRNTYAQFDSTVCADQLPMYWNNVSLETAGTYVSTLRNHEGADSVVTMTVHVVPTYAIDVSESICDSQSFVFEGSTYAVAGDYPHHLLSSQGCDSLRTLHLEVRHPSHGDTVAEVCDQLLWHDSLYTASTEVTQYAGLNAAGCDSTVSLLLTVYASFYDDRYDTICDNDTLLYGGQQFTLPGEYVCNFATGQLCDSIVTLHLSVNPSYSAIFTDTMYVGDTVDFEGELLTEPGFYTHRYTSVMGCDSLISLNLVGVNLAYIYCADSVCEGDTFYFFNRALTEAGEYVDTILTGDFLMGDTVVVLTLSLVPQVGVEIERVPYCGKDSRYELVAHTAAPYIYWQGVGLSDVWGRDTTVTVFSPADSMTISCTADYRVQSMCPATDSVVLIPIPNVKAVAEVCSSSLTMDNRQLTVRNFSQGQWERHWWEVRYDENMPFRDTSFLLQLTVPVYVDSVVVMLTVDNDYCSDTDFVKVEVLRSGILFPNVFTPNLSENNVFKGYSTAVEDYELWIYDRRGDIVFHTTELSEGWDGTKDGHLCQEAAYVYKCRYRDELTPNGWKTTTGTVTLIR